MKKHFRDLEKASTESKKNGGRKERRESKMFSRNLIKRKAKGVKLEEKGPKSK